MQAFLEAVFSDLNPPVAEDLGDSWEVAFSNLFRRELRVHCLFAGCFAQRMTENEVVNDG